MGILSGLAGLALNEGAKLLKSGFSSTMFVEYASNGDIAKMQNALNNGADINAKDPGGMPALFIAVEKNQLSATKFLLENGAYPDITDKENDTPLMRAMYYNRPEIAKLLIEYGVDINIRNKDGKRAIDYAKEKRISDACKMLSKPDNYGYATRKLNLNKKSDLSNTENSNKILDDTSEIDIVEQLSKLKKLREQDLIDDEEYKAKKAELLAKM